MFLEKFSHQSDNFVNVFVFMIVCCTAYSSVGWWLPTVVLDWPAGPLTLFRRLAITRPVHLNLELYDKQSVYPVLFGKMGFLQYELPLFVLLIVFCRMNLPSFAILRISSQPARCSQHSVYHTRHVIPSSASFGSVVLT